MRTHRGWLLLLALSLFAAQIAGADTITLTGVITQDAMGSAINNTDLNNITMGDSYEVTLNFAGTLTTGTTALTGTLFQDTASGVSAAESAFISGSIVLTDGGTDTFTVLACLADCIFGNQLDLYFTIPDAQRYGSNVTAGTVFAQKPFELLEDGGGTDIMGTVDMYSYATPPPSGVVPEPATLLLCLSGMSSLGALRRRTSRKS